jgi:hypothetical protein
MYEYIDREVANHKIFETLLDSLATRGIDGRNFVEDLLDDATGPSLTVLTDTEVRYLFLASTF